MADGAGSAGLAWAKGVLIDGEDAACIVDREAQVIGAVLSSPEVWGQLNHLEADDFCVDQFRRAWATILTFARDGELHKIRPAPVAQAAQISVSHLLSCARDLVSLINAPHHAQDMIAARAIREAIHDARGAQRETDPTRVVQALQRATKRLTDAAPRDALSAGGLVDRMLERLTLIKSGAIKAAPTTGFSDLDGVIGGLAPSDLQVWAGRPGMGKTAFTFSMMRQAAASGARIGVFSLEIGEPQTTARFLADAMYPRTTIKQMSFGDIMRGNYRPEDEEDLLEAAAEVRALPLHFAFRPGLTVADIDNQVDRWSQEAGAKLDAILVDQSSFVADTGRYRDNTVKAIGEIFLDLKMLAKRRDLAVVAIHQLNRGVESREDKRPTMADLRDSGEIEQNADAVCLLYRREYYLNKTDVSSMNEQQHADHEQKKAAARNKIDVIVDKTRSGDPKTITFHCNIGSSAIRPAGFKGD